MDPYKVLGVSPDASDDEVRQAYRQLAKKYHPDSYVNNPIADLAAEKMKEINTAYDMIVNRRANPGTQGGPGQSGAYSGSAGQNPAYSAIRSHISYGNLEMAEELLVKISQRDAEWYFLMGSIYFRRGWMDQAADFFGRAAQMEPQNPEYAAARNRMNMQRNVYQSRGGYSAGGCSPCDACSSLLCADCCCECMGGDLISCC